MTTAAVIKAADPNITGQHGPDLPVTLAAPLSAAGSGCLTFISKPPANLDLAKLAGAVVIAREPLEGLTTLVCANPRLSFMRAVARFFPAERPEPGIQPTARVHDTASVHATAHVGAGAVIGPRCIVGARSVIRANVVLYQDVRVGEDVSINSGTVIGADGFGYERNEAGELEKFPHIGGVVIMDGVEIGSNTSIDRGSLGDTVIGKRTRIDNLVHIAHNVVVGEDAAIIALSMIGGSCKIGDRAWVAPSATVMNKVDVGADATVGLAATVVKTVKDGETVMGSPAMPDHEFKAQRAAMKALQEQIAGRT